MDILVVGAGYVGLVSAACFAELGHRVIVVDNDESKINALIAGNIPIHEALLPELLARYRGDRLHFSTDIQSSFTAAEIAFICVGTPPSRNGDADLSYVEAVARELAISLDGDKVVVEKSTVPARTCEAVERTMQRYGSGLGTFTVASNPEFLREGTAVSDFLFPDRIVIGADTERSRAALRQVYRPLIDGSYYSREDAISGPPHGPARLILTSVKSAELIKHASNAFLAMKISFINAVANVCEGVEADVREVCEGIGSDSRIGPRFLNPGIGYGGSCFPKDVLAFRSVARDVGYDFKLLTAVMEVNEEQKVRFIKKVREALWNLRGKHLAVLGLAFKGGTDDVRDSPAIEIVAELLKMGAFITAFDPAAMSKAEAALPKSPQLAFAANAYEACSGADAVLVLTEWPEFAELDLTMVRKLLRIPVLLDGKNIFDPRKAEAAALIYYGVGSVSMRERRTPSPPAHTFLPKAPPMSVDASSASSIVDHSKEAERPWIPPKGFPGLGFLSLPEDRPWLKAAGRIETEDSLANRRPMIPQSVRARPAHSKGRIDQLSKAPSGVFVRNPNGSRKNIFWIHTLSLNLAKELGTDQPFVFVTLTIDEIPLLGDKPRIEAIAARLLRKLLVMQNNGPYILGGVCIGGVLAFEIASQLEAAGHDVSLLVLLDAPIQPYLGSYKTLGAKLRRQRDLLIHAATRGPREVAVWFLNIWDGWLRKYFQGLASRSEIHITQEMIETAATSYYPATYLGKVLLLLPRDSPSYLDFLPGWQSVVPKQLHTEYINGPHRKFITLDNVKSIASVISSHLSQWVP